MTNTSFQHNEDASFVCLYFDVMNRLPPDMEFYMSPEEWKHCVDYGEVWIDCERWVQALITMDKERYGG